MSYKKQDFVNGQILMAEHLNYMENAIGQNAEGYVAILADLENLLSRIQYIEENGVGGGGGANNATLSVLNKTDWLAKTIATGNECVIALSWQSVENDIPTGQGILKVTINGATKVLQNINQGEVSLDISQHLSVGDNTVRATVSDVYGNSRSINYSVTVVAISISSTFDTSVNYSDDIAFTYIPTGRVAKKVYFILDGAELDVIETTASGTQQSYIIPAQDHGAHSLEVYFTAIIDGQEVKSNTLYYEIVCIDRGVWSPIIASSFTTTTVEQYNSIAIRYRVYNPSSSNANITLSANGDVVGILSVDRTEQVWTYRADAAGEVELAITCGSVTKTFKLTVTESTISIIPVTNDLILHLSSYGRSNNEDNPDVWEYGDIKAEFTDFNFTSDGWVQDNDDISVLRVAGDARLTIPLNIFEKDFRTTGETIEIEFATRDIMNYDSVIVSCFSGNRGIELTAQRALLRSEQSELSAQYKEDEHARISFVVEKRAENRLLYCYINGVRSGVVQYPDDDDFSQMEPVGISIGSNDCTIDLYNIRVYSNNLTRSQMLLNWIADTQVGAEMRRRYEHNDVFDEYDQIVISKLPKDLPYLIIECPELPQYKGDKKICSGSYVDPVNPSKCFTFKNAEIDVQGTSSQYYARKNYKIKFKGGFILTDGKTVTVYAMNDEAIPVSEFTFKADVASSEGANNVELARLYDDTCPYKTAPQIKNDKVRQGIDGFPIVIFWNNGTDTTFLGKYNFNNDKATPEVFGFTTGDESWEIKNNTSDRVLWKSADFSGTDWKNDFEARYPKDNTNISRLVDLAEWLVSTDTTAATNTGLRTSVTYNDVTYTTDSEEYRLAKFKAEFEDYFVLDAMLYNYLFTELFLMVDNRAKNAFPTYYKGDGKWIILPYDYDTAIGTNNEGALVFSYELEDIDITSTGADVYNGQESVLYVNIRKAFYDELTAMYQTLRSEGKLSYEDTTNRFEEHQNKWPEAIFNEDSQFKYIDPLLEDGNASYLSMLQGDKEQQRKWWLFNRFRYIDSKYVTGDALTKYITIRGYAKSSINITPYADIYATVKYGSYLVQKRALRGNTYTLECPLDNVNDTEIYIYSSDQLKDVGDLSGFHVGYADFSMASRLQALKLGDASESYSNRNLNELYLGNNQLLKTIDIRNCPNLGTGDQKTVDLSGCTNIENIYFDGTSIAGVNLPNGGILKVLHLPGTITSLTLRNQKALTDFVVPSYANITTLRLENVSDVVDGFAMLMVVPAASRVRLVGFDWSFESVSDITSLYDRLDTMRGLDENHNNVDDAQMVGTVRVDSILGSELAELESHGYLNINIVYQHITSFLHYYNHDGSELLYTETIVDCADGTYDGEPSRENSDRFMYDFNGWSLSPDGEANDDALLNVTSDRNVYAAYEATPIVYLYYYNYDGSELLHRETFICSGNGSYDSEPSRESTAQYDYEFSGWSLTPNGTASNDALLNVTSNRNVYAAYISTIRKYTVYFYNDSTLLQTVPNVPYGGSATYLGNAPTMAEEDYEFRGWSPEPVNITGDTYCYAQFKFNGLISTKLVERTLRGEYTNETVKSIGSYAFHGCTSLTSVSFPVVTSVGTNAFQNCTSLTSVSFPVATYLGGYAFHTCRSLTSVNFPAVTSIGTNAFYSCTSLTSVSFPVATYIGSSAFCSCRSLTSVNFPAVTSIGSSAFCSCTSLTSVNFPVATYLGDYAFLKCTLFSVLRLSSPSVCTLMGSNAFLGTKIASGTGYIYVPASLSASYKTAGNWTAFSNQFRALEDYTVNGTVTGDLDESKI